ncbi:GNAT family N-acetyltransferase [Streptomyces sp. SPB074]|uniref:GNAT family N-acetyltransferase n=1 Tax=Streptomyces sp. (strain SPB074) TaxID=465543 RepID=UPI00017FEC81|nr:GNAT family N-acetyltransferase [Streptomyces sp. SPB074]EDY45350.1 GNAT family acetyltransferase [Streptomyces sp. SPB074]
MTIRVRDLDPEDPADLDGVTAVLRAAIPPMLVTPELLRWQSTRAPAAQRHRLLLAEDEEGRVIGRGSLGLAHESPEPGLAFCNVYVHPGHEGRGAGTALVSAAEEYLASIGARTAFSWVLDGERDLDFARRSGWSPSRSARFQRLDLTAALPSLAPPPAGVELRPASAFADDPRPLFRLDAEATADEPGDVGTRLDDYEDWLDTTWGHPLLDRELTTVALVDGAAAAFTVAHTDGARRYFTGMTGTARAHRGRGLAKRVKLDSLSRARAAGLTEGYTSNDAENTPMLAVNKWCGYVPAVTEVRHAKPLG